MSATIKPKVVELSSTLTEICSLDLGSGVHKEIFFYFERAKVTESLVQFSVDNSNWDSGVEGEGIGDISYRNARGFDSFPKDTATDGFIVLVDDSMARFLKISLAGEGTVSILPRISS